MKPSPAIHMICFDLFGVILKEGHLISNALLPMLPDNCDQQQLKRSYDAFNLAHITELEFWSSIGQLPYQNLRQQFLDQFELDANYPLIVRQLRPHYRLSILSNLPPDWAISLTEALQLKTYFDPILFSGMLGCKKPHPEIYRQMINRSGIPAHQILFIDDRLENLRSAHEAGMCTLHYQKEIQADRFKPDYTINCLSQILQITETLNPLPEDAPQK